MKRVNILIVFFTILNLVSYAQETHNHSYSDAEIGVISDYIKFLESLDPELPFDFDQKRHDTVFALLERNSHLHKKDENHYSFSDRSLLKVSDYIIKLESRNFIHKTTEYQLRIPDKDGNKKTYHFQTLKAMDKFIRKEKRVNAEFKEMLKSGIDLDIVIIDKEERRKRYKLQTLDQMNDVVLKIDENAFMLKEETKENEDFMLEFINDEGGKEKFVFKNLNSMKDFMNNMETSNPELYAKLNSQDNLDVNMIMPNTEKKKYNFQTLSSMKEMTLNLDEKDFKITENTRLVTEYTMEIIGPDGTKEKYNFKTLESLKNYMLNLSESNPEMYAKLKKGKDYDIRIRSFQELQKDSSLYLIEKENVALGDSTLASSDVDLLKIEEDKTSNVSIATKNNNVSNPETFKGNIWDEIDITKEFNFKELIGRNICDDVLYGTNVYAVTTNYMPMLDKVYACMVANKDMKLLVEGHSDITGNPSLNYKLSEKRAKAVVEYLKLKGIEGSRLKVARHGQDKPVASNKTDEGRAKNRRVEIRIR